MDLETAPGDGEPGLVAGRDSEGVPGMDICAIGQPVMKYIETRCTYYVNQLVIRIIRIRMARIEPSLDGIQGLMSKHIL